MLDPLPKTKPVEMTRDQRNALERKFTQNKNGMTWQDFFDSAEATFGCDGAIVVQWCGMWLCIEVDGYTHS